MKEDLCLYCMNFIVYDEGKGYADSYDCDAPLYYKYCPPEQHPTTCWFYFPY